jgi:hypothetical protein
MEIYPQVGRTVQFKPHDVGAVCEFPLHDKQGIAEEACVREVVESLREAWKERTADEIYFDHEKGFYVWVQRRPFVTSKEEE